jgi:hypothetical protein
MLCKIELICAFLSIEGVNDMKKYTCWKDENSKVEGAIVGTKEEVLAWMQERFPEMKPECGQDEDGLVLAWVFFYEGNIDSYVTKEGESIYLVELIED